MRNLVVNIQLIDGDSNEELISGSVKQCDLIKLYESHSLNGLEIIYKQLLDEITEKNK